MKKVVKNFTKESDKEIVREILKNKAPMVVRFYAEWCPICKETKGKWRKFCEKEGPSGYSYYAIEEKAIPEELLVKVTGFPTYAAYDKQGPRHVAGHQEDLLSALKL